LLPESFENWHRVYVLITAGPIKGHGAAKKQQNEQAIGKSRGSLITKIHAAVDAFGNPVRLRLTAGQALKYLKLKH
jgi:hypothetical protein